MNQHSITNLGIANEQLRNKADDWWHASATFNSTLRSFDSNGALKSKIESAQHHGWQVGTVYSRFSTKLQHSTDDQVRECVQWAGRSGIYVPPELISVDEGVKGKRLRRAGLNRTKAILSQRLADVMLVFKASRLFRQAGKGYQFINEEVVEEGLRAVSVSQGIDTNDRKTWKLQLQIHGLLDDLLLDAIADHVRSGLTGLFLNKWTTGAIGVGYRRKEIPGAPPTNRGRPRTMPEVDPEAAELIREHARLLIDGMPIREGVRRWNQNQGPCDPRSSAGMMTYPAYRRLFSNPRLIGKWEFGRRRNQFSTKLDYVRQVEQSDDEVTSVQCEELRILDDQTFRRLQSLLDAKKTGRRGPRQPKKLRLWDLTTDCFYCDHCSAGHHRVRFHQTGANGAAMRCKNGDDCDSPSTVRRSEAVLAVCKEISRLVTDDTDLVESIARQIVKLDGEADRGLSRQLAALQKRLKLLSNRIEDLFELSGEGTDEDRREIKARLQAAQSERRIVQNEVVQLEDQISGSTQTLSLNQAAGLIDQLGPAILEAAEGELGDDAVYKALAMFRCVTGSQVRVRAEQRPNRKRFNVRGWFMPQIVHSARDQEFAVWLRKPPRLDAIAERVHELIDQQGLSHRGAAAVLREEGHNVNSGNVWYSYRRWYEMQGLPVPQLAYNNGRTRRRV
ncbi:recombinase family protein [Roseiconus lacunae]|uniref:Recombinase family protein n=1 Tax=Roseiconus lacunae TaxID=2605694 RepID=A0ABT7PF70_9BACT|nr:recombinase family protein [Roseiconus lacunae]MDM4015138.1 recombinase family protein [Roseiconus lacunae]